LLKLQSYGNIHGLSHFHAGSSGTELDLKYPVETE